MHEYIIAYDAKWWHFFIKPHMGLCVRTKDGFRFADEQILLKSAHSDFCVTAAQRSIYLVCQDISGNIFCYIYDGTDWRHEILLESKTAGPYDKHFTLIPINGYINLLYTIRYKDRLMLVHQTLETSNAPHVVDYIKCRSVPYTLKADESGDFTLFYENEDGLCGARVFKWSKKDFMPFEPLKAAEDCDIRFALGTENGTCFAAVRTEGKNRELVFIDDERDMQEITPVYSYCEKDVRPILSRYNEKLYMVWTERGLIMSVYRLPDSGKWSAPLKYAGGNPANTKLYAVYDDGRYSMFYGISRGADISLCGTHDILKKPPQAPAFFAPQNTEKKAQHRLPVEKDMLIRKIAEQESVLRALKEELTAQKNIMLALQKRIDEISTAVPLAEDGVVDDVLMK